MNCSFDGSVGGDRNEWLALAGLIATDAIWAKFQTDWSIMLANRDPAAPWIHMTDLLTGNGPFERKYGWTDEKVRRLIWDAVALIVSVDQSKICGFACAVDLVAHKTLHDEGYQITKPAVICAETGIGSLLEWYIERHDVELAHLFFDQGEPFIRSIRGRWLQEDRPKRKVKHAFWGMLANVEPVSMKDTPAVQAADILAWAFARRLRNTPGDEWATFADILIGNRLRRGALTNTQLDPITEDILRDKYPKKK